MRKRPYIYRDHKRNPITYIVTAITPTGRESKFWKGYTVYNNHSKYSHEYCIKTLLENLPKMPKGYTWSTPEIYGKRTIA